MALEYKREKRPGHRERRDYGDGEPDRTETKSEDDPVLIPHPVPAFAMKVFLRMAMKSSKRRLVSRFGRMALKISRLKTG